MHSGRQRHIGIVLAYVVLALDVLISIIYTPILLRILGDQQYGLYQLIGSLVNYLAIMDLGFGSTITRYMVKFRTEGNYEGEKFFLGTAIVVYCGISFVILVAGAILYFLLGGLFKGLTNEELSQARFMFVILVSSLIISLFDHAFSGVLSAYELFSVEKGIKVARVLIRAITIVLVLQFYNSASIIVLVDWVLTLVILFSKILLCKFQLHVIPKFGTFDFHLLKELFTFTSAVLIQSIANQFNNNVDKTVLGFYSTTSIVAVYSVAMTLFSAYSGISTAVQAVYFPRISTSVFRGASNYDITKELVQPSRIQFCLLIAICEGYWLYGKEFLKLWCNKEEAWIIAGIIMSAATIELFQNCTTSVLKAKKMLHGRTMINLFTAGGNFAITMFLVPKYGMLGAAWGTVFSLVIGYGICCNIYYVKVVGIDLRFFFRAVLSGMLSATLLSLLCGFFIKRTINMYFASESWGSLGTKCIMFSLIYCIFMFSFGLNAEEKRAVKKLICECRLKR